MLDELLTAIEAEDRTKLVELKARRQQLKADEQRLEQMKLQIKQKYRVR